MDGQNLLRITKPYIVASRIPTLTQFLSAYIRAKVILDHLWENTVDLSERNYLPYIQKCAENEDWLGWLKTDLFKDKAKLV